MPSHLTRLVFRRITANEPLLYRGCCCRAPRPRAWTQHGAPTLAHAQQRTFLDLLKPRRKLRPAQMPAGLNEMAEVTHALDSAVRPPPPKAIAEAFKSFFAQNNFRFDNFHMVHAHNAFNYLLQNPKPDGSPWITRQELDNDVLEKMMHRSTTPEVIGPAHLQFGRVLLAELARMLKLETEAGHAASSSDADVSDDAYVQIKTVRLLSLFGAATEARTIAARDFPYDTDAPQPRKATVVMVWGHVIAGCLREQNLEEVVRMTDMLQSMSIPIPIASHKQRRLVGFFCRHLDLERAKFWYSYPTCDINGQPTTQPPGGYPSAALLTACAYCGDRILGQEQLALVLESCMDSKSSWDAIFLWSAAIGKGPDEVDRMMNVLIRRNDEARQKDRRVKVIRPDVDTINSLVEFCMSKNDPYAAERYITIGEKRAIWPNEKTFAMQMQYRISVGDLDGAKAAYFNLQGDFSGAEHSVAVINEMIRALCVSNVHHFDDLMAMVDDLHERKANFDSETIAALTLLHLRRGEIADAMDLLQVHAFQYSPEKRRIIQKALSLFILDGETSTSDAWDGYQILRNVFPETAKHDRIAIMKGFFSRKRSDMACHVFFHMRNHVSSSLRADRDVYIEAFTGYARCADAESLELTHNQLRLDMTVDRDTKLRNALMLAYACTKQNPKALQFWREICESKEGPTYNSIVIAFRSCEGMHWGGEHARSIWKRLIEQDVDIDKTIWTAYMCAIARNHDHDEALALVESVEEEYGFTPDLSILGNWYNMTPNNEKQSHVEAWIKKRYPNVWQEMEALGHWVTFDGFGYRQYNIDRNFEP
ncbi:complex I intermediate-associated protein-like protein 84 [Plenodomus tracheiphilus IPT5]|uniref:Complex I intermediate-associated protein-like protein 84 n=1 Tax=Plenodomus tracheiphilus IPT5 TaxID=1408161 RepID=A0A6A7AQP5_9PLEO|nr:complex I intermediate-associated protein-like protein 84 [Plenodomus tracheiphilus IPT5]